MKKAVPNQTGNSTAVVFIVLKHRLANYSIPSKLLTDNSPQFVSKFFVAVFSTLVVTDITTTEYHPNANEKRSDLTLKLCHDYLIKCPSIKRTGIFTCPH